LTNLYTADPKKAAELASQLEEWKQIHTKANSVQGNISKEDINTLKSLGYVE